MLALNRRKPGRVATHGTGARLTPVAGGQERSGSAGPTDTSPSTIDGDDLARERARLAKQIAERTTPVGRADDRMCVRVSLDAISLAFSLVEEGSERVSSELLLVASSRHGPSE